MSDWENRCTDCDDTGVTIQTERRCACQPPMTTSTDGLVEQLRDYQPYFLKGRAFGPKVCIQAADRIEAQAARIAELEGALDAAYPLLAAWNCELVRTLTREPTRKPVKAWLERMDALRGGTQA